MQPIDEQPWDQGEYEAELEVMAMTIDELDKMPFVSKKWLCKVEGCCNGTYVRDYGFTVNRWTVYTRWKWLNLTGWSYICGKHHKAEKAGQPLTLKQGSGFKHLVSLSNDRM